MCHSLCLYVFIQTIHVHVVEFRQSDWLVVVFKGDKSVADEGF